MSLMIGLLTSDYSLETKHDNTDTTDINRKDTETMLYISVSI